MSVVDLDVGYFRRCHAISLTLAIFKTGLPYENTCLGRDRACGAKSTHFLDTTTPNNGSPLNRDRFEEVRVNELVHLPHLVLLGSLIALQRHILVEALI